MKINSEYISKELSDLKEMSKMLVQGKGSLSDYLFIFLNVSIGIGIGVFL